MAFDYKLIDSAVVELQTLLEALPIIGKAYGVSEIQYVRKDKNDYTYPAIRVNDHDYINLFPDHNLGNYTFFTVRDTIQVQKDYKAAINLDFKTSLTCVIHMDKAYGVDADERTIYNPIDDILSVLSNYKLLRVESIEKDPKNVFNGYSTREIDVKYYMHPYSVFKFNFNMRVNTLSNC
jgi:hypothetical protein